jgi:hypothetical protein
MDEVTVDFGGIVYLSDGTYEPDDEPEADDAVQHSMPHADQVVDERAVLSVSITYPLTRSTVMTVTSKVGHFTRQGLVNGSSRHTRTSMTPRPPSQRTPTTSPTASGATTSMTSSSRACIATNKASGTRRWPHDPRNRVNVLRTRRPRRALSIGITAGTASRLNTLSPTTPGIAV